MYFCCHPEDFDRYFDKICEDIFASHEPAIYYTADMSEVLDDTNINVDLGRMNLFVVPVTFRLMNEPNRAMSVDIAYAKEHNIPILPFMMESGIDSVYALSKNFGERQYLSPYSSDTTGVSYEKKLENYLKSILISDEMANRVRAAFDAYIFLSYRKKDRRYADDLMRIIHNIPGCRDIAIWYDEFLTPGESFMENIEKAMQKSELFALLVTPNLLEDGNFVMTKEYPAARANRMKIFPAEMEETDRTELQKRFAYIPECVRPDNDQFDKTLTDILQATEAKDKTPEHNFLMGLAYLEGIDVEVDIERGIALVTAAAEAGLPEAMEKLYYMFDSGDCVVVDYQRALYWALQLANHFINTKGIDEPETLKHMHNLACAYDEVGDYNLALQIQENVYTLRREVLGAEHSDTLSSLGNLASYYSSIGDYAKALDLKQESYIIHMTTLGPEHPETIKAISNLAVAYIKMGDYKAALPLQNNAYNLQCNIFGEKHPNVIVYINNIAYTYSMMGDHKKALELKTKAYELSVELYGEEHPKTLIILNNLSVTYMHMGDNRTALELQKKIYDIQIELLGEKHPDSLRTLENMAGSYANLGKYYRSIEIHLLCYKIHCEILGENHPYTLHNLNNLAVGYARIGDLNTANEMFQKLYNHYCITLGEGHPDTLDVLGNIAYVLGRMGKQDEADRKSVV